MNDERPGRQYKLRDLIILTGCIALILALLLPLIRIARDSARQSNCHYNIRFLMLAVHNYESTYRRLPNAMGGTGGRNEMDGNLNRLSGFVALTLFLEASSYYERMSGGESEDGQRYPAFGPAPWVSKFTPWNRKFSNFRCPSAPELNYVIPHKNYAFCIGDVARNVHNMSEPRGMFAPGYYRKFTNITDGLSNTIALCEIGTLNGLANQGQVAIEQPIEWLDNPSLAFAVSSGNAYLKSTKLSQLGRGANWVDGAGSFNLVNTILPPNAPSILMGISETSDGFFTAGSYHFGGVNLAMGDGSVRFISNDVDTGDLTYPVPTTFMRLESFEGVTPKGPYGVWGSMGSAAGAEGLAIIE